MKITNKFNLPQTFVNVTKRPTYTKAGAHLSATELMGSPRIVQLRRQHEADIEMDVTDMVWSIFGTAIHGVLEHGKDANHLVEERLKTTIDGWSISGAIDLQIIEEDGIIISDYKTTGAWAVMNEKQDWTDQLNIYAWLVQTVKQKPVKKLEIVAIIRDWSHRDATTREAYPDAPIKVLPITLWSYEEQTAFIRSKIHQHSEALFAAETGGDLPECSPEQVWEKPTMWAIKKIGGVRAKNVCMTEEEAKDKLDAAGKGYFIEVRPGERTRCAKWCQVKDFCNQWKEYQEAQNAME
jgi:hypothetical protein